VNKLAVLIWLFISGIWMGVDIYSGDIGEGVVWGLMGLAMIIELQEE